MLRRLELIGFKSFAEKTRFEFSPGLTAIVGPNGSGKSNVVDAIRWILGEQSAKSLRGQEMADVIFNGSASRRSLGLAEVTMTLDNARRHLAIDVDEVQITRRVYRDGEGEYLINQQPSRLKDVKELFLGSGAGTDAYCIIEQGRVDVLLQASTRDRRVIFEEAAGISRFKAKKIETLRKLERVGQNLQRLRDILDEVDKQLRAVKLQAAKAQRYQEYHERLKQLRVGLGLREYHELAEQLKSETAVLDQLSEDLERNGAQAAAMDEELRRLEQTLGRLDETLHVQETMRTEACQRIAAEQATLAHERGLEIDLEADIVRTQGQSATLAERVGALAASAAQADVDLREVEGQCHERRTAVEVVEQLQAGLAARIAALHDQLRADKLEHFEQMRQAARLHNDAAGYKAHVENLGRERERLRLRGMQAAGSLASLDLELRELAGAEETVQAKLADARQALTDQRSEGERLRQAREDRAGQIADLRARRSGLASRVEVLEGLERGHEGLGAGVREVFAMLDDPTGGSTDAKGNPNTPLLSPSLPFSQSVRGLVADLLSAPREHAHLIDLALGAVAQCFLVRDETALEEILRHRANAFSSRVSFLPLRSKQGLRPESAIDPLGLPGSAAFLRLDPRVIAPADCLVSCADPELTALPRQLLGRTFLVADLATARALAAGTTGFRFITLQGELLEADGTLTVGTHHAEGGLLSRKSELRELREQAVELDQRVTICEGEWASLRDHIHAVDAFVEDRRQEVAVLAEQATDLRARIGQHRERLDGLQQEVTLNQSEMRGLEGDLRALETSWNDSRAKAEGAEQRVRQLETQLQKVDREIHERENERQRVQQDGTAASVALAQAAERLEAMRAKHGQIQTDWRQRVQEQTQTEGRLRDLQARLQESRLAQLRASGGLAVAHLDKESAERALAEIGRERDQRRSDRQQLAEQAQVGQAAWRAQREQAHARELAVNDLRHRRDQLVARLREDYQLELAELYQESGIRSLKSEVRSQRSEVRNQKTVIGGESESPRVGEQADAAAALDPWSLDPALVQDEMADLRKKLTRLGSVNLEALRELTELEERAKVLQAQFDDLTSAQRSLEEIITKINGDSRKLFADTFAAIRAHFQELFRKLFGGGMAEIVLEDENDILESGIDIIARPPGKELRNLSLMSGGEKTMTAVALLLAIFRSKPSPFCILDEVDAALDEANIGRFTAVLRDFLDRSQFILITHSKRTMAAADMLYGITMQESGVSKRVAVRFEDWPDDPPKVEASPLIEPRLAA
jgi:chromosome segregation protein